MKLFSIISFVIISLIPQLIFTFDCNLPNGCYIQQRKYDINEYSYEKNLFNDNFQAIICTPLRGFQFRFEVNDMTNKTCIINDFYKYEVVLFKWPKNRKLIILDKSFNVPNMLEYLTYFYWYINVHFVNLRGIDINLSDTETSIMENNPSVKAFIFIASTMNFYTNGKLIKSCEDILESNSTIVSIFQINRINNFKNVAIDNCEFPNSICPLVFKNSNIYTLFLMGLVDSFYKNSTLTFTNNTFNDLNSTIYYLELDKVENINLDLSLLNPSVFRNLDKIFVFGALKSIDKSLFTMLPDLNVLELNSVYFRKLIRENGIDWIREINKNQTRIDLRNVSEVYKINDMRLKIKYINIQCDFNIHEAPLFEVFPDEDFCVYKDFPFDQLVILMKYCFYNETIEFINTDEFTCTYLWLTQHFEFWYQYFWNDTFDSFNIKKIIESKSFKERSKCDFDHRLELCNKTNYRIENIWSTIDYYYLNKKLQSALKISSYVISLFGIASNLLIVTTIVIKSNSDLFKGFKQYTYLCINSVFCLMILVINILSWTTECFYPFEVFCPEIRKIVFFQFFKIIFKECLTTTFRFMLNFTYVAFALNRIVTIRKDQNKFINFICEMSIKVYIAFTLIISVGLSFIKYFKYDINFDDPLMNYPISNEWDIFNFNKKKSHTFDDAYFIMNFISDIINYVIFVLICVFIDIYMVIELRQVMADKLRQIKRLFSKSKSKIESAKKENDDIINKVIRMVLINTAFGLLFKMPLSFIPILNVHATFYYKDLDMRYIHPSFGRFYSSLFYNGFYGQISDLADFLFILSISIQPLIYKNFDKKIQISFDRIFHKNQQPSIKSK